MTQTATRSKKILGIHTIFAQIETKCYGSKPSPEGSPADEENQYSQVTISQKFLTAYKETGRIQELRNKLYNI